MPCVTTITWVPLKKDAPPPNPADYKDYPIPKGITASYYGKPADPNEPAAVELVSSWDSVDAVKAAHASPEGIKFREDFEKITDTSNPAIKTHHNTFVFANDFAPVADAPVVEQTIFFVPTSVNKAEFTATWEESLKSWNAPAGWLAGTFGWGEEEIDQPPHLGGGKCNPFLAAAGWESIEKAQASREVSQAAFEPLKKFGITPEMAHSRFTTLVKGPKP